MIIPGLDRRLGGTTTLSIGFYEHLSSLAEVTLVTTFTQQEQRYIDDRFKKDTHVKLFPSSFSGFKFSLAQYRFVKKHIREFDIVHIHGLWHPAAFPAARLALRANVPYVLSPHGMLEPDAMRRSGWKKKLLFGLGYKRVFENACSIHCTAANEIKNVRRFAPRVNTIYVPNGVTPSLTVYPKVKGQILFIGRLHPKKAVDRLIDAFSLVDTAGWHLIIAGVGDADYEMQIKELVRKKNPEHKITMIGFVEGAVKEKLIAESMFVCVPSFSEGMPLVSLEAMAAGTPLLITKASNVPEVSEFTCGIELEDNEPETIAKGLTAMQTANLEVMSANARTVIQENFLWKKVSADLYQHYQRLLGH
jgi:poly(glycerol-phosphate) alpha-glucosyltransferase